MIYTPLTRGPDGWLGWAARAATTSAVVRDGAANLPAVARAVLRDSDGLDFDNVEHVRQNRLKRWQTPADPTRRDTR